MSDTERFCSMCGEEVSRQQHMKNREGDFYCMTCFAARKKAQAEAQAQQKAAAAASPDQLASTPLHVPLGMPLTPEPDPSQNTAPQPQSETAGLLPSAILLAASFTIMTLLHLTFPADSSINLARAIGAGIIHTFFISLGALALIVSLLITLRITGGESPGYLGKVLAKALGLALGLAILNFFTTRSESFGLLSYGFRGAATIIALLALFNVEFLEAIVLSLINTLLGWALALALAFALLTFASIGHRHSADEGFDDENTQQATPLDSHPDWQK